MTTYWLNGEKGDHTDTMLANDLLNQRLTKLTVEPPNQLSLTPFRQRREQSSRPSSRRGSASFLVQQKSYDGNGKKESDSQPLLRLDDRPLMDGEVSKDLNSMNHPLLNNVKKATLNHTNSLSNLSSRTNENRRIPSTPPMIKSVRIGNNNWFSRLASPDDIPFSEKKTTNNSIHFSSSIPLLKKNNENNDSVV